MLKPPAVRIHPTAIISPEAQLADDVVVGPYVVIEGAAQIGPGCVIKPQACLFGPFTMGRNNTVYTGVTIGEQAQHLKFKDEPASLEIGDGNVFREGVTVHRGTVTPTRIGNDNYFMANSHVAHDCQVGSQCIFANGALLGGHCVIADRVFLSGNCAVHQFARVGRLAMLSGCSISTKDAPPYIIQQGINCIVGVNIVGMHRAGMTHAEIQAVRRAFHIIFHGGLLLRTATEQVEKELGQFAPVMELVTFIRQSERGISTIRDKERRAA